MTARDRNTVRQEPEGVDTKKVVGIVSVTLAVFLGAVGVAYLLLPEVPLGERPEGDQPLQERQGEVLVTPIRRRAVGLERHEEARKHLLEYGWVDEEEGLIHVPVEQAMELYLERHRQGDEPKPTPEEEVQP